MNKETAADLHQKSLLFLEFWKAAGGEGASQLQLASSFRAAATHENVRWS
jgi:hypothetical protein